jgi:RNA polymerase sigma-70 factor (ECF subfamily)
MARADPIVGVLPDPAAAASVPTPEMAAVFEEHFGYVWNSLRRLGVRESDLEDLAHEVFLKVHANLRKFDPTRPMRPWLFGFAYRVVADHRRLARNRLEVTGVHAEAIDSTPRADERLQAAEQKAFLDRALAEMDLDRRAVLVLHDVDGVPVPEIARALGVPLNTAYSRLRLAREELARAVKFLREREVRRG